MPSFPLIQLFPAEILLEIFAQLDAHDVFAAALVCEWWRTVALEDASLWSRVVVEPSSLNNPDFFELVLQRSGTRSITLAFLIHLRKPKETQSDHAVYAALWRLLTSVFIYHLGRCTSLRVVADEVACGCIAETFAGQSFPRLQSLYLVNVDVGPHWEVAPTGSEWLPVSPSFLYFELPAGHQLKYCRLQGFTLGNPPLPNLSRLLVQYHSPALVIGDALNAQVFNVPHDLHLHNMCIPVGAMSYHNNATQSAEPTNLTILRLSRLRGTPLYTEDLHRTYEYHSGPFFVALNTSCVRYMIMGDWDANGYIMQDFIETLPEEYPKFPKVSCLRLRRMVLGNHEAIARFLKALPALRDLYITECPETALAVLEVLELDDKLCPRLRQVDADIGILIRKDPPSD